MFALFLLGMALLIFWLAVLWTPESVRDPTGITKPDVPAAAVAVEPASLEGILVRQLTAGAISRRRYLHAMAQLAASDAERRADRSGRCGGTRDLGP